MHRTICFGKEIWQFVSLNIVTNFVVQLYISNMVDIRRKLYFYFYFIVIQEVNHRVGRNQIDVVDIGGGLKVKMKE